MHHHMTNPKKSPQTLSIGMFDSGVGGLTVMKQITKYTPKEHIVYFGDTARVPYGEKSRETIIRYSIENSIFLMQQNIKILVIACNTASAYALEKLRQIFNIPVIGVIEPGAQKAVEVTRTGRIAVLGTKGTVNSGVYQAEIKKRLSQAVVTAIPCPLFVPLVEEQFIHHASAKLIVKEYLAPLQSQKVDTVLLGCTHYPLLRQLIEEELGPDVSVVDSAMTCAEQVLAVLKDQALGSDRNDSPQHNYYVSDDPEKFRNLGRNFLGIPLDNVEAATLLTK